MKPLKKTASIMISLAVGSVLGLTITTTTAFADGQRHYKQNKHQSSHGSSNRRVEYYKVVKIDRHKKHRKEYSSGYHRQEGKRYRKKVTYYNVGESRYHRHSAYEKPARSSGYNFGGVTGGRIIGALLGGAAGTQFGKGRGRVVAVVGGAIIGAVIGGEVGRSMQQSDHNQANRILEQSPTGQAIRWNNPDTGRGYKMTPTRTYRDSTNRPCRDYTSWVFVDGYEEKVTGRACRMSSGRWKILS